MLCSTSLRCLCWRALSWAHESRISFISPMCSSISSGDKSSSAPRDIDSWTNVHQVNRRRASENLPETRIWTTAKPNGPLSGSVDCFADRHPTNPRHSQQGESSVRPHPPSPPTTAETSLYHPV